MTILRNIILFCVILLLLACEDDVSYYSEFEEEAILYCIINVDSAAQEALIMKSYEQSDDPGSHYIQDAEISLSSQYNSVMLSPNYGDGITSPEYYYSTNDFKPVAGSELTINAILPDKRELKSTLSLPKFSLFYFDQTEFSIPLDQLSSNYIVSWNTNNLTEDIAFLSYLYIDYSVLTNEGEVKNRIEIPVEYQLDGNVQVPVYPTVTENHFQSYNHGALDYTLKQISEGDTNKSNYKIIGGALEIYILEENLATYYASAETFKESFTVKLFETIISNIEGGKGVFGAYIKKTLPLNISRSYIRYLGYSTE